MWLKLLPIFMQVLEAILKRKLAAQDGAAEMKDSGDLLVLATQLETALPKGDAVGAPGDGVIKIVRDFIAAVRAGDLDLALQLFMQFVQAL